MTRHLLALKPLLAVVLAGLIAACAPGPSLRDSHGELPTAAGDMGRIYFFRPPELLMSAVEAEVVVNSRKVGNLAPGTVFYRDALPGRYRVILADNPDEPLEFSVTGGSLSFIEVVPSLGSGGFRFMAQEKPRAEARPVVMELTLIEASTAQ